MSSEILQPNLENTWENLKIPESSEVKPKYFNLVEITANGNTVYGFIRESTGSLVIPVFSESPHFYKNVVSEWNQTLLEKKDKRFSPKEFCETLGIAETSSLENSDGQLLVGKYCMGPVTNWHEVGILIKLAKETKYKSFEIANIVGSKLGLQIKSVKLSILGVLS